jgi:transitional endoplasmic reticulum ATPase
MEMDRMGSCYPFSFSNKFINFKWEALMFNLNKPSFPKGWALEDGSKILKRVDKQQFVEVFALDSDDFLYLFHDPEVISKIKSRNLEFESMTINDREVLAQRDAVYNENAISELLTSLLCRRGLDAIAGMTNLKGILTRDIILPFLNWESYEKYGVTPSNGVLFFGPPGCGKTFIARKLAEALRAELIEMSEGTVGSPYIHATSNNIVQAFRKAEQMAPCVLFVDEISGLMPRRDNLSSCEQYREAEISEFLMHMEGSVKKKVLVIGATNFPEKIDPAILRSGRMDKRIFIPPPDKEARYELFQLLLEERPVCNEIDYQKLARITEGLISSDLKLIVNNAALRALQKNSLISMELLTEEASRCKPSLNANELNRYLEFEAYQRN